MCTESPKRQRQERCLLETANTCTQKLRTRLGGVFADLPAPCDDWGLVGAGVEGSPDKWGSLHNEMTSQFVVVSWPQRGTGQG